MSLLILAHGATWDRRFQVTSLAATTVAADQPVGLALFFGALQAWVEADWDRHDPAPPLVAGRLDELGFPPLSSLLVDGRASGLLRVYACSASVRLLGYEPARVQPLVDAIFGWQTFSTMIADADRVVTF
jgi:peroxiredoxin family protein